MSERPRLQAEVRLALEAHGIAIGAGDTAEVLRDRLNDVYLVEVRRLRERQRAGEIPLPDYAEHVEALRARFALLGLPIDRWVEDTGRR